MDANHLNTSGSEWNDLYVRTGLNEPGPAPDQRTGGVASPDICPVGTTPVADPWDYVSESSYNTYISNPLYANQSNFIYVRTKNSSKERKTGKAYLSMSDPAIILWPGKGDWTRIKTQSQSLASVITSKGDSNGVPGKSIGLTYNDPFVFIPEKSGHRCLVTWLSTEDHPMSEEPPKISTMSELGVFLKNHPNYAHHNINIEPSTPGMVTKPYPFSSGDEAGKWVIGVKVVNGDGYKVGFNCGTPLKDGKFIDLPMTDVTSDEPYAITLDYEIQQNFDSSINISYDPQGQTKTDFGVSLVAYLRATKESDLWDIATPFSLLGASRGTNHYNDRGILLGSMTILTK